MPSDYEAATNTLNYDKANSAQHKNFASFNFGVSVFFHVLILNTELTGTYVLFICTQNHRGVTGFIVRTGKNVLFEEMLAYTT